MTKVGLLNVQNVENYGANLIAYAMEQEIKEIVGSNSYVCTINFQPDMSKVYQDAASFLNSYLQFGLHEAILVSRRKAETAIITKLQKLQISKCIKEKLKLIYHIGRQSVGGLSTAHGLNEANERSRNFERFRQQYLNRTEPCFAKGIEKMGFDVIVVGSDVVWKPRRLLVKEERDTYFLQCVNKAKKVAYAASIGVSDPKELFRLRKRYKKAIQDFDAISIRESSGTQYIQSIFPERKIFNCIDPVFLRPETEYRKLIRSKQVEAPYIYVYILGNNLDAYNYAADLAKEKGLHIFYHTNRCDTFSDGESVYSDGPQEFLERISNASYVVTDSFHGTAFSIIMKKQFLSFTRGTLSIRLENFMSQIGLSSRLVDVVDESVDIDAPINYDDVQAELDCWVKNSKDFLRNAINGELE